MSGALVEKAAGAPRATAGERREGPLPVSTLLAYAAPSIGMHFVFMLMGLYFFKFATDVLLVAPGVLGVLLGVSRLWDAASDPIAGYLSDRTHTRFGRRRPWIAGAALPFGISVVMLWSPPAGLGDAWTAVWVGLGLLLFYTTYTAVMVPYGALGAELSQDYHDRTRLFAWRYGVGTVGMLLGVGAFYLLLEAETPETAVLGIPSRTLGSSVAGVALLLVCLTVPLLFLRLRERAEYRHRGPVRVFGAFGDVWRNPHARRLLGVQAMHFFSMVTLSLVAAFTFQHVMRVPSSLTAALVACFALGTVCAIPLWVRLAGRFGKDRCWRTALVAVGVMYSGLFFLLMREGLSTSLPMIVVTALCAAFLGAVQSSNFVLSHSMQADVIDWDEYATGERKEGAYLATWSFVEKCAGALAAVLIGAALQAAGYQPGGEQAHATRLTILGLMTLLPGACHFVAALLLRGFTLDRGEHARIRGALDARQAGSGEGAA